MGICWCFVVCLLLFGGWGDLCFSCWLLLVVVYCACGSCVLVVDVMGFVACCCVLFKFVLVVVALILLGCCLMLLWFDVVVLDISG